MAKPKYILLLSLLPAIAGGRAMAHTPENGRVWASAGPFFYQTKSSASGAAAVQKEAGRGGAIVAEGDVDYNGGVEIAMVYLDKTYIRTRGDRMLAEHVKRMHITTGYRHWFIDSLAIGGAVYSAYSMGDPKVIAGAAVPEEGWITTARAITEYGFDFSLAFEVWQGDDIAVGADLRYSVSLSRKQGEDADAYGALLAFKYLVPPRR